MDEGPATYKICDYVKFVDSPKWEDSIVVDVVDNGLQLSTLVGKETCDVKLDLLNQAEDHVTSIHRARKILSTIEVDGHSIYKSTLVLQLNNNIFLSKDRLARIKHSIQFNNHDNCLQARSSSESRSLCIKSDCGVHFVQQSTRLLLSTTNFTAKQKRGYSTTNVKAGNATNILNKVDINSWWVGRVLAMRWRNGKQFGVLRQAVDLLA